METVLMVEIGLTIGLGSYWAYSCRRQVRNLCGRALRWVRRARFGCRRAPDGTASGHPRSVGSLGRFSVVSVVAMDRTAIVAYRSRDRDRPRWLRWTAFRRPSHSHRPQLQSTDHTLVLRVADDTEAERAWALLDRWRRAGTVLCLRPTAVPSTVNLSDDVSSTLQAVLSAD